MQVTRKFRNAYKVLVGKIESLVILGTDGRIILVLKSNLKDTEWKCSDNIIVQYTSCVKFKKYNNI